MNSLPLFETTHTLLLSSSPKDKVDGLALLYGSWLNDRIYIDEDYPVTQEILGGLPSQLSLVEPKYLPRRRLHSVRGRAALVHAILHIEFNAINLALDAIYRFRGLPLEYYGDWLRVAREEAYHFKLLQQHLLTLGFDYGDFPAHLGLWEMAQKTGYDVLVRMALVPRLLEARGLDVTPDIAKRLQQAGDNIAAEILKIIFHDEIGHVMVGNTWYHYLCVLRQQEPLSTFVALLKEHAPDYIRGPLALVARRKAGFNEIELDWLNNIILQY